MTLRILFPLVLLSGTALAQTYPSPTYQGLTLQSDPTNANQAVRKSYLDQRLSAALPNLSACLLLGGAGSAGMAQGVALGAGLSCSANTIAAAIGTAAGTVAAGNDSRIVGAVQAAGGNASATTVTASGGTAARTMGALAADRISVLSYGAVCDGTTDDTAAVQAAFAAAAQVPNGAVLEIPQRACLITGAITQSIGAKRSIHLRGAGGMSGFVSSNGSGIAVTLTDGTAGFDASDLAFMRSGSGQAGVALSVQASVTQAQTISHFRNLLFSGVGATWQEGLRLVSLSAPVVDGMRSFQPDGTGNGSGYGLHITGSDTSHFLTDAKVTNSLLQGGFATIKIDGAVQGVYIANTEGIGSDYGVHAADATGSYLQELLTVTNSHWNNALAGIYLLNYNENQISNNLFLHFSPLGGRAYQAVYADHSGYMTVTGNTFLGAGLGAENFFKAGNAQLYTVTGNNAVTLAGLCIDTSASWNVVVTGNSCQGVTDPGIAVGATSMVTGNIVNGRNELVGPGSGVSLVKGSQANSSGFLSLSANVNLVGTGSGQSDAAGITANQVFVSTVPAGSGVKLPLTTSLAASTATAVEIWNNGSNPVLIYPSSGETILGNAANAPISIGTGTQERCWWPGLGTAWVCSGATNLVPLATLASPTFTGTVTIPSGASIAGYAPLASPTFTGAVTIPSGASIAGYAPLASPTFTGAVTIPSGASIAGYAPLASPTFTGTVTIPSGAAIAGYAPLASPSLSGSPTAPTASADTSTTQLATTGFVLGQASTTAPAAPGTAAVGSSTRFARADHVHPTDTTRAPLASPALTGVPTAPTAAVGTNTTQLATTAFVTAAMPASTSPSFQIMSASGSFVPAAGSSWVRFRLFGPGGNGGSGITCASGASCSGGGGGGAGGMTDFWVPAARVPSGGCTVTIGTAGSSNTAVSCGTGLVKTAYRGGTGASGATSSLAGGGGAGGDISAGGNGSSSSTGGSNVFPNTGNAATPLTVSAGASSSAAGVCSRGADNNYGPTGGGSGSGMNAGAAQGVNNCGGGENPMSTVQSPIIGDTGCEPNVGGASGVASTSAAATAGGAGGVPGGGGGGGGSGTVSGGAGGAGAVGRVCIWQG